MRDKLDGPEHVDRGIRVDGRANIVPSTPDAIAFTPTPQQVLRIVYLTDQDGVSQGGFYPSGMNGNLKTTWGCSGHGWGQWLAEETAEGDALRNLRPRQRRPIEDAQRRHRLVEAGPGHALRHQTDVEGAHVV